MLLLVGFNPQQLEKLVSLVYPYNQGTELLGTTQSLLTTGSSVGCQLVAVI